MRRIVVAPAACSAAGERLGELLPVRKAELAALAALPDDRINTDALPEQRDWSGARRGVFCRPIKET